MNEPLGWKLRGLNQVYLDMVSVFIVHMFVFGVGAVIMALLQELRHDRFYLVASLTCLSLCFASLLSVVILEHRRVKLIPPEYR